MPSVLLHRDQVPTDTALVGALLAEQHPELAGLPVTLVASSGTDHDVYRLGDDLAVRLPKIAWAQGQSALEARWLPRLAPHLPLALPRVVAAGRPGRGYPFAWSVVTWLPGRQADPARDDDERTAADLAAFVTALRSLPLTLRGSDHAADHDPSEEDHGLLHDRPGDDDDAPPVRAAGARGGPLAALDDDVRSAMADLGDRADRVVDGGARAVLRCWDAAVEAPAHQGEPVWAHGDLLPGNLLAAPADAADAGESSSRLGAVIDWGALGLADPAVDLQPAWNLLTGAARQRFRDELAPDDAAWARGRGVVVHQTVQALPYYWATNPGMVAQASRALAAAVADTVSAARRAAGPA